MRGEEDTENSKYLYIRTNKPNIVNTYFNNTHNITNVTYSTLTIAVRTNLHRYVLSLPYHIVDKVDTNIISSKI